MKTERRTLLDTLSSLAATTPGLSVFIASCESLSVDLRESFPRMERVLMASAGLCSDIRLYVEAALQERVPNEDLVVGDLSPLGSHQRYTNRSRGWDVSCCC